MHAKHAGACLLHAKHAGLVFTLNEMFCANPCICAASHTVQSFIFLKTKFCCKNASHCVQSLVFTLNVFFCANLCICAAIYTVQSFIFLKTRFCCKNAKFSFMHSFAFCKLLHRCMGLHKKKRLE